MGRSPVLPLLAACLLALAAPAQAANPAYQGDAQLLVDTTDTVGALQAMVRKARHSILVDYFLLAGPQGEALAGELIRRHQEGLAVRVMLDPSLGRLPALKQAAQRVVTAFNRAGVPVRYYPVAEMARRTGHSVVRDHNKAVVVDLAEAYVGSLNFGPESLTSHDVGVWFTGNAAHALGLEILAAFEAGEFATAVLAPAWPSHDLPVPRGDARIRFVPTGLSGGEARNTVIEALNGAVQRVDVLLFKLADPEVETALIAARRRGVEVRVLLDPGRFDQVAGGPWVPPSVFNLEAARRLAAGGVAVKWYTPRPGELALHAKAALVDRTTLLVGSTNWTRDGFDTNHEAMLAIAHGAAPRSFQAIFEADWRERSEAVQFLPSPLVDGQIWLYRGLAVVFN